MQLQQFEWFEIEKTSTSVEESVDTVYTNVFKLFK